MISVTVHSQKGLAQEMVAGIHAVIVDEPLSAGGSDLGPNPYEMLLGALGSCKAMTMLLYARRKEWDLQEVEVRLTHTRDYARDCEECLEKDARLDRISVQIKLMGRLDDQQQQRLREIAARCPVHQTLMSTIEIREMQ